MQEIVQVIQTVGFPIVCCMALFYKMNKQDEQHKEEMKAVSDALNNNTLAITRLVDKMGGETDGKN